MTRTTTIRITFAVSLFFLIIFVTGCASLHSANSRSRRPIQGKRWNVPLSGNKMLGMVWINPGKFTMGSPSTEPGRKVDESPQTVVTLSKGYWLGETEVTIGQWKAVTGIGMRDKVIKMLNDDSLYDFDGQRHILRDYMRFSRNEPDKIIANEDDRLPMYFVSWYEAIEFCETLTLRERAMGHLPEGYEYTLPTEAQWEFACRAGTTAATFAGSLIMQERNAPVLDSIAWYRGNSAVGYEGRGLGNPSAGPRNSGEKLANAWGLRDMPGNIWEWCRDWYGRYPGGSVSDPTGPRTGMDRVNRGGSWGSGASDSRSANRAKNPPAEKSAYRGFRIALCAVE